MSRSSKKSPHILRWLFGVICAVAVTFFGATSLLPNESTFDLSTIPTFAEKPYVVIDDNVPHFSADEMTTTSYEQYSDLDVLGRCGMAMACIGEDIMPTEDRTSIGSVKPSGWQSVQYDIVSGTHLYNRSHLIGFQLTGENANKENLVTGTRYMNVDGMLPFENMVADYVKETGDHVMYRVTPLYEGTNLVAHGVQMEGYSVEDEGEGVSFNVYVYNNQPGITINYADGTSALASADGGGVIAPEPEQPEPEIIKPEVLMAYILNTSSMKAHLISCGSVETISDGNKETYEGAKDALVAQGYDACGNCDPW